MTVSHSKQDLKTFNQVITLKDGSSICFRPIRLDDQGKLLSLFSHLSPYTLYMRFHYTLGQLSEEQARYFCNIDYNNCFALVAVIEDKGEERIVADARYYRLPHGDSAEVAVVVDDDYQGLGVGVQLLLELVTIARDKNIRFLEAEILAENHEMMALMKYAGQQTLHHLEHDVYRVVVNIATSPTMGKRSQRSKTV